MVQPRFDCSARQRRLPAEALRQSHRRHSPPPPFAQGRLLCQVAHNQPWFCCSARQRNMAVRPPDQRHAAKKEVTAPGPTDAVTSYTKSGGLTDLPAAPFSVFIILRDFPLCQGPVPGQEKSPLVVRGDFLLPCNIQRTWFCCSARQRNMAVRPPDRLVVAGTGAHYIAQHHLQTLGEILGIGGIFLHFRLEHQSFRSTVLLFGCLLYTSRCV